MRHAIFLPTLFLSLAAQAKLVEKTVEYRQGDQAFEGFLAYDDKKIPAGKKAPGVLVVHDWLGLTEKTKEKARELAQLGFVAFAADIYGKGVRPTGEAAGKQAGLYKGDRKLFRDRLNLALEELRKIPGVNDEKLGAVGFCFGGTGVIELARSGAPLKGVVSFHGGLDSPDPAAGKNIRGGVLALHGADDPFVSAKDLAAFEEEMRANHVDWALVKFGNAVHSFTDKTAGTDNSKGAAYNPAADRRAWALMRAFFAERF